MNTPSAALLARLAVLVLAEVKAATEAFDRGETNIFDALHAIVVAVEAYRTARQSQQEAA